VDAGSTRTVMRLDTAYEAWIQARDKVQQLEADLYEAEETETVAHDAYSELCEDVK
jgi:hypothetical protein